MQVAGGVETLTVAGATPGQHMVVRDAAGRGVVTVVADERGNAFIAFVPPEPRVVSGSADVAESLASGHTLTPGDYSVDEHPVRVLAVDDHPDPALYDRELNEGYGYLMVRDGVQLSVMVRFPNQDLHGPPPYPTVVEYSGYSPSDPDTPGPGSLLANLLGFAVVGVNMRGTGCSGGVFDLFSPAQAADGYDVIETVARQPWVLHGHVGMVGLSYPGISQLYVAATRPPHLAAITPMSVIDDPWRQQWPGGIYNSGFTRAWIAARDVQTRAGGQAWDQRRIEAGDEVARANQEIRSQNFDFESFGRATETYRPEMMDARRAAALVDRIEVPVYLTGAWQDEQTGSRFALMLDDFAASPEQRFTLFNGHHPDGYSPMVLLRWFEFLSFHVARRVPVVPELIRQFAPLQFAQIFGATSELEPDRFSHHGDDVEAALAEYRSEPRVRILFDNGAGGGDIGAVGHRHEVGTDSFPPPGVRPWRLYLAADGALADAPPSEEGADRYEDDPDAGGIAYAGGELATVADLDAMTRFTRPGPELAVDWTRFAPEHHVEYLSDPLTAPATIAGAGHVELWLRPGTADTAVQATLSEVRDDGVEVRVQCGWHRPVHRVEDDRSDELRVDHTFTAEHRRPLTPGEWIRFRLPLHPFAHVVRAGSKIRLQLSTPGRDHPFWCFENPVKPGVTHELGRGGDRRSALVLPAWYDAELDLPDDHAPAGSLRGQPTRPFLTDPSRSGA